ncbi:MAG: hypothetical protein ACOX66_00460 [Oscillospiraceae bacterium]|jgi:ABC-2 type transport system permease protein
MKKPSIFMTLFKVRLQAALVGFSGGASGKKRSKGKTALFALLMLYVYGIFFMMFMNFFSALAAPLHAAGLDWLYFTLFGLTAFCIMFILSVFATKTQLYDATDNELLLSMPVQPGSILASRMAILLLSNFLGAAMIGIPAIVMWRRAAEMSGGGLTAFILLLLALPFFALAVASLIGWLIALSTDRVRNKSLMTVIITLVFLGVYFVLVARANVYLQKLIASKDLIAASLGKNAPLYWFGNAIAGPSLPQLLWSLLILLLPFLIVYIVLSKTFISVATKSRGAAKVQYRERSMHETPVGKALLQREKKRLFSSPVYLINAGLGVLFLYVGGAALLIEQKKLLSALSALTLTGEQLAVFAVLAIGLITAMVLFTAPSVSLEGKTIWIIKSLPLTPQQILAAKLRLHRRATLPAVLFLSLVCVFTLDIPAALVPGLLVTPCLIVYLSSSLGLIAGLQHANLEWINETQVVKQGMAILLAMLFSFLLVLVPFLLFALSTLSQCPVIFLYAYMALLALGTYLSDKWVFTKGAEVFDTLG